MVWAHVEGDLEFTKEVTAQGNRTRAMEGNGVADILTYLPTGHVATHSACGQRMVHKGKRAAKRHGTI